MTSLATNTGLCVWVVESTPASNVARCVGIGIGCEAARLARELVACWTVFIADASTRRASPARVSRVNQFNRYPDKPALVGNLRLKVCESPRVQDSALLFSSPNPRTNMRQIFQRYSPLRAFSNFRNLFGDGVVRDLHKTMLAPAQSAQHALGRASAFGLKPLTLSPTPCADTSNLAGVTESLAVGAFGEIGQSQINSNPADGLLLAFFRHVHRHVQKPFVAAKNQIRFAFWKFKQFALSFSADKRKMLETSLNSPKADGGLRELEIQNAGIVGNAAIFSECALDFPIKFVGVGDLRIKPHDNLRGQRKFAANLFVKQAVHWKLTKLFLIPSQLRKTVGRSISRFQSLAQRQRLFWRRQKFYLNGQLHAVKILKHLSMSNDLRRNNHSVSRLLVHLVFVVKYRRAVISEKVWTSLVYGFGLAASRLDLALIEVNHDQNHAHLVVEYPPKVSVSEIANALKGNSSFVARRDCKEELRSQLWGSAFWTPSFFASSCGGAPLEVLKLYVQSQQTKGVLKDAVSTHRL